MWLNGPMDNPYAFLFTIFFGAWIVTTYLQSLQWRRVARRYSAADEPTGRRLSWASIQFSSQLKTRGWHIGLDIVLGPIGLYMAPNRALWLLNLFKPALMIPWTDIHFLAFASLPFGPRRYAIFVLGDESLLIERRLAEEFKPFLLAAERSRYEAACELPPQPPPSRWKRMAAASLLVAFMSLPMLLSIAGVRPSRRRPPPLAVLMVPSLVLLGIGALALAWKGPREG